MKPPILYTTAAHYSYNIARCAQIPSMRLYLLLVLVAPFTAYSYVSADALMTVLLEKRAKRGTLGRAGTMNRG